MFYKLQKYLEFKKNISKIYKNNIKQNNIKQNNIKIEKHYLQSPFSSNTSSLKKSSK